MKIVGSFKGEPQVWEDPIEMNRVWRERDPDGFSPELEQYMGQARNQDQQCSRKTV